MYSDDREWDFFQVTVVQVPRERINICMVSLQRDFLLVLMHRMYYQPQRLNKKCFSYYIDLIVGT